jgi:hypothetical protein
MGKLGRCFRVEDENQNKFVLKIVLTANANLNVSSNSNSLACAEYYTLLSELEKPHVVPVKMDSLFRFIVEDRQLGISYLMCKEGDPIPLIIISNKNVNNCLPIISEDLFLQLIKSLQSIHKRGMFHGDPRVQNGLIYEGEIMWVDFMNFGFNRDDENNILKKRDLEILITSVYNKENLKKNEVLQQLINKYKEELSDLAVNDIVNNLFHSR